MTVEKVFNKANSHKGCYAASFLVYNRGINIFEMANSRYPQMDWKSLTEIDIEQYSY